MEKDLSVGATWFFVPPVTTKIDTRVRGRQAVLRIRIR